ncbi:cutinase family protein [Nocardia brasiliensis]|uniref:cutinase family protein n=1 Tax=Nocardia brasiliensis TaxID=37326 RepID=UPI002453DB25|nr:cutinase family protein [Nocardia brasiliensis]
MFVRTRRAIVAAAVAVLAAMPVAAVTGAGAASADPCTGTWSIGIGGLGNNNSSDFWGRVNQPVGYDSNNPITGVWEVERLMWSHRDQCPGDHIKLIGHSEGAGIVHTVVTRNPGFGNANAILLADPKRGWEQPGGPGMADLAFAWWVQPFAPWFPGFLSYPLAGVDDYYGDWPVLSVCHWQDWVCNTEAVAGFSHATGLHSWAYDFNSWAYGDWDNGPLMLG